METELLVAEEVAELLRVDQQRVYELVWTSELPFIRFGRRQYRFSKGAIVRWLEAGGSLAGRSASDPKTLGSKETNE